MDTSAWIAVTREDGETVGYLEPVTPDYGVVQPRSVLGHVAGEPCDYVDGEERLCEQGIAELMQPWVLEGGRGAFSGPLAILEVSPHGIVVADALLLKALAPTEKTTLAWPDVEHRLEPSVSGS
ncbi:hypothetical protein ACSYDW_01795 [Paeniglutamicibacter sp. R2-26]|uniref:hypothetical protein n=1 Tax=Paeniglutamicibacter sp. R2-26 TaxID=3144417 RepID=UPI003EE733FE